MSNNKYLPSVKLQYKDTGAYEAILDRQGSMTNSYSPFQNLQDAKSRNLQDFTTELLNFDLEHPVDIIPQDSYDGSVNLILNDGKNSPRLVGSRFSVIEDKRFKITDHKGFKDTNIYDEKTFSIDTSLKSIAQKIPQIEYQGLTQYGGSLKCGAYTFYFKLSDADGNESEVVAESGLVQVFIGGLANGLPDPKSIRMGLEDENSGKSVTFKLTNLDSGFDYVHVLYARSSSGNEQAAVDTYHKVVYDYPAFNGEALITVTGKEVTLDISANELYVDYADINAVKTQTVLNNVLFFGNLKKTERDWEALARASWKIRVGWGRKPNIGTLDAQYTCGSGGLAPEEQYSGCYYNTFNTYYRVGYWPDEIYQFGIVYIFNDNSLSPVFPLQGMDLSTIGTSVTSESEWMAEPEDMFRENKDNNIGAKVYSEWENEPDDYYFDKTVRKNSKGVIKFPQKKVFKKSGETQMVPTPLYIRFSLDYIGRNSIEIVNGNKFPIGLTTEEFFKKQDIKGYFFVRRTRIPTIIAQGLAVGLTDKDRGALPVIKEDGLYKTQSFLQSNQLITPHGATVRVNSSAVTPNAALVPDAELSEATFNQIFVGNKFALNPVYRYGFSSSSDENGHHTAAVNKITSTGSSNNYLKRKLTVVQDSVKTLTDGEMYFSTRAGIPEESYKTKDVNYVWDRTLPQLLTESKTLVRGNWGPFVGIGKAEAGDSSQLVYGNVYNIKTENYANADLDSVVDLEFQQRFSDVSAYKAICHRTEINSNTIEEIDCYRGDCFQSLFTHRVMRNFIDPELPTNDKIINPRCWAENYAVRNTAIANATTHWNVTSGDEGWKINSLGNDPLSNEIATSFEVKATKEEMSSVEWDATKQAFVFTEDVGSNKKGDIAVFSPIGTATEFIMRDAIHKVTPKEQQTSGIGGVIKNLFKSDKWELRGIVSINRADVNAVALGEWITFPICSPKNLALRDVDYSNASEQASFNRKRSFYPLSPKDATNPLRDSNVINQAASISIPHKSYYAMPDTPFIKQEYFTRIVNSLRDSSSSITNEFKVMLENAYQDYTKIYGSITKLVPLNSYILIVFEHGLGIIDVTGTMQQAKDAASYLPTELNGVLSDTYGSMWKDSIIETDQYIYGVDTVAKAIWRVSHEPKVELISNMKVEKFLIDAIDLSEFTNRPYAGRVNVKSHYNAFKHDVMFTYYNDILYEFKYTGVKECKNSEDDTSYYIWDTNNEIQNLNEYKIDIYGYLLNSDGNRLLDKNGVELEPGSKVTAYYDQKSGKVVGYTDQLNDPDKTNKFKWATGKSWSLCFNEITNTFTTFYDWIPIESANIDNIWFSFDREAVNDLVSGSGLDNVSFAPYSIASVNANKNYTDFKDLHYGKYAMDKAFNTHVGITYMPLYRNNVSSAKENNKAIFQCKLRKIPKLNDSIKATAIGVYLKGSKECNLKYHFEFVANGASISPRNKLSERPWVVVPQNTEWKFYAIVVKREQGLNYNLRITCYTEDEITTPIYGAISDVIFKDVVDDGTNSAWVSHFVSTYTSDTENTNGIYGLDNLDEDMLDDFYFVRDTEVNLKLWKHGQAGIYDNAEPIKPTHWYGKQHEFNFEFVVRKDALHKVFTNLQIISNKTEPSKFEVEIVGESYDWHKYKPVLKWIADQVKLPTSDPNYTKELEKVYLTVLKTTYGELRSTYPKFPIIFGMKADENFKKLPFMKVTDAIVPSLDPEIIGKKKGSKNLVNNIYLTPEQQTPPVGMAHSDNTITTALVYDKQLNEFRVHTEQLGNNIAKYGRLRGNMQYLEDLWRVELRPIAFKYAYLSKTVDPHGEIQFSISYTKLQETRFRDKYCKIKIRYSGEDLAVIQAIATIFDYSYA